MSAVISAFVAAMLAAAGITAGGSGTSTYLCGNGGTTCAVGATPTPKPVTCGAAQMYEPSTNSCVTYQNGGSV